MDDDAPIPPEVFTAMDAQRLAVEAEIDRAMDNAPHHGPMHPTLGEVDDNGDDAAAAVALEGHACVASLERAVHPEYAASDWAGFVDEDIYADSSPWPVMPRGTPEVSLQEYAGVHSSVGFLPRGPRRTEAAADLAWRPVLTMLGPLMQVPQALRPAAPLAVWHHFMENLGLFYWKSVRNPTALAQRPRFAEVVHHSHWRTGDPGTNRSELEFVKPEDLPDEVVYNLVFVVADNSSATLACYYITLEPVDVETINRRAAGLEPVPPAAP